MKVAPSRRCSSAISARTVHAQLGVEVAERLVHQEDARVAHHGAGRARRAGAGRRRAAPACASSKVSISQRSAARRDIAPRSAGGGAGAGMQAADQRQALPDRRSRRMQQRQGDVLGHRHVAGRARRTGTPSPRRARLAAGRRPRAVDRDRAVVGCSSPAMMRSRVDLPQPEGPSRVTNSPARRRARRRSARASGRTTC